MNNDVKPKLKVAHISTVHPVYDTRIFLKQCSTLANFGHEVVYIGPGFESMTVGGVRIVTVNPSISRLDRVTRIACKILHFSLKEDADIYHFHDPELIGVGLLLHLFGKKVIYDVHEDLPNQIMSKPWIPRFLRSSIGGIMAYVEKFAAKFLDGIMPATHTIAQRFPNQKTALVRNFPILDEFVVDNISTYASRPNWIAYIGGLEIVRGLCEMVSSMALLPEAHRARLKCAGQSDSPQLIEDMRRIAGGDAVDFLGWQNRKEIVELLGLCRMGLVVLHPIPNYLDSLPIKLFEYMSAGIPVVASDFPLWREIVGGARCGILVDPLDARGIADAIQWLLEHPAESEEMGKRGQAAVVDKYNWGSEAKKLLSFYDDLANHIQNAPRLAQL